LIAAAALAAFWLGLALFVVAPRRRAPALPGARSAAPATTVLLPVRDEEQNVADCARSLLAQPGAVVVRAVDDGSLDATPRILAELEATERRLDVVAAGPLRPGMSGKVNALATGFERLSTPWVLLTDADTRHAPGLLARAHAAAAEQRLDALSLAGTEEARGLGENLLTPPVYALLDLLLGDWSPQARGEGRDAVANGQYFLVRAEALRAIGGFAAIAGAQLDDVALARALRAGGFRTGFRRAGGALAVRMYRGFGESVRGWRRNLALLFGERPGLVFAVFALAAATMGVLATLLGSGAAVPLVVGWAGGALASALIRGSAGNNSLFGLLFPLDIFALALTLLLAYFDRQRGKLQPWRGRSASL
jgi:glycosyltransferase involved in cell wall biosynthesis